MIEQELRLAVLRMHEKGTAIREIGRRLSLSRNTVKDILKHNGEKKTPRRKDLVKLDPDLITQIYGRCKGYRQRMMEMLKDEHDITVSYSTLTRITRELGLGQEKVKRACRVPDQPGEEMQHDTSTYPLKIAGVTMIVIASLLYYRYSKAYYLQFYTTFNRFRMKCALYQALMHFGYSCKEMIIDNTHLAVDRGTGVNAVMAPEMASFGRWFGFKFKAHAVKHSDRKAGEERGFWTVETNFFPGRDDSFTSLEDLNEKALIWSTQTMHHRPRTKAKIIPAVYFEHEKNFMKRIPEGLPPPYRGTDRTIDQHGYVSFDANHYWTPETEAGEVRVHEYSDRIKIIKGRREIAAYMLPPAGTKNKIFPEDRAHIPYRPVHSVKPTVAEESELREAGAEVAAYLDMALPKSASRHRALRRLHGLYRRLSPELFLKVIQRAQRFGVTEIDTLEDIARIILRASAEVMPSATYDEEYVEREAYQEGRTTDRPDLSLYDKLYAGDDE